MPSVVPVTVEMSLAGDRIAGQVRMDGRPSQPYEGWLQLISALQQTADWLRSAPADAPLDTAKIVVPTTMRNRTSGE